MRVEQKELLIRTIHEYRRQEKPQQKELIQSVKDNLNNHYTALNSIGMGYADHYVGAAKVFLKIFDR